jgi:hypothetical protein
MSIYVNTGIIASDDVNAAGQVTNLKPYELPTDGLLFHLNAHNYTGAGPWYDNVQNIPMNLVGTANPKTLIQGIPAMQFNGSGYWESSTANGQACDMTGEFTLVMVVYASPPPVRKTIFEKIPNTYQSYEQELAVTWETNNAMSYYTQYNAYSSGGTQAMSSNTWNFVGITIDATRQNGYYFTPILDFGDWIRNYSSNSSNAPILANGIRIGSGYAGTVDVGYLHSCLIYGASLSAQRMANVRQYYLNLFSLAGATLI